MPGVSAPDGSPVSSLSETALSPPVYGGQEGFRTGIPHWLNVPRRVFTSRAMNDSFAIRARAADSPLPRFSSANRGRPGDRRRHRPGLCRPAARAGLRRARASRSSASTSIPSKVDALNAGESYIEHIAAERSPQAGRGRALRRDRATSTGSASATSIIICVPTPLTEHREPDLSLRREHRRGDRAAPAARASSSCSNRRPIRAPRDEVRAADPRGERACKPASDFFLAFSPEREDPGNADFGTATIPKVVGGDGADALAAGRRALRRSSSSRRRAGVLDRRRPRR